MKGFARQAGLHKPNGHDLFGRLDPFSRLQILTLDDILKGTRPELPYAQAA